MLFMTQKYLDLQKEKHQHNETHTFWYIPDAFCGIFDLTISPASKSSIYKINNF